MEEWDVIAPVDIPQHRISSLLDKNSILGSITGSLSLNLGRTVNSMQRAMGFKHGDSDDIKPIKQPMSDMEFHNYLDSAGYMVKPNEFRLSIYQGGIETSLRRVAWRHLLNVFPIDMSGKDRFDYMKRKEEEYRKLREEWRERFRTNTLTEEVKYVASMVKKDVLRTDRTHGFYAGNDENENTLALFHILVTYALTHPDTSYCQGMSDIASPLLVTQKDEAQAYICFCSLMERLKENFTIDGEAIMTKFKHLTELLTQYDPDLQTYLLKKSSGEMFFCYRWLLLELKREFPFNDALHVLEVMWATLPPSPPQIELSLVAPDYSCRLLSSSPCSPTFSFQQAMYAKLLAMRRVGALHRVTQAGLAVPKASQQTQQQVSSPSSENNNLHPSYNANSNNEDSECHLRHHNRHHSVVSSSDASPVDFDDKNTDFPEIDNPMLKSLQRKSDSIDQVLLEVPKSKNCTVNPSPSSYAKTPAGIVNENEVVKDEVKAVEALSQSIDSSCEKNGFSSSDVHETNQSLAEEINDFETSSQCSRDKEDTSSKMKDNGENSQPEEDGNGIQFNTTHFTFDPEEVDHDHKKHNTDQSSFTESTDQVQFNLSIDSGNFASASYEQFQNSQDSFVHCERKELANGQNSATANVSSPTRNAGMRVISSTNSNAQGKSESSSSSSMGSDLSESSSGLFQSMKRLLSSPKKRPSVNSDNNNINNNNSAIENKDTSLRSNADDNSSSYDATAGSSRKSSGSNITNSDDFSYGGGAMSISDKIILRDPSKLPPPQIFGAGNPFLMFLCFTIISQHRESIMRNGMCYEEIAMHFDRLVRRHNASHVLHHARQLYTQYLKSQQANIEKMTNVDKN